MKIGPRPKPELAQIKGHMLPSETAGLPPPWAVLNSNESVFGPSPHARAAARAAVSGIERYMENVDTILAPAIAELHGLDPDRITTGQGSDDLLARLFRAYVGPGDALIRSANGYLKVPNYAFANGAEVVSVPDDDLTPSVDHMIAAVTDQTRIVYLANPENPAGTYVSKAMVERLHAALPDHVLLVLDCAYADYAWADDFDPCHYLAEKSSNVVVCHTFSKIYGLAGARVGWAFGPNEVIETIRRIGLTFPIATPSVAAVLAALEDQAHVASIHQANRAAQDWFRDQLTRLGLDYVPSQTNFVLVRMPDKESASDAVHALAKQGIVVRQMAAPAYADTFRVTLGLRHELEGTIRVLESHLAGAS